MYYVVLLKIILYRVIKKKNRTLILHGIAWESKHDFCTRNEEDFDDEIEEIMRSKIGEWRSRKTPSRVKLKPAGNKAPSPS